MMELLAMPVCVVVLVSLRLAYDAIHRRAFARQELIEQLHRASSVTILVGDREIKADLCFLKSIDASEVMNDQILMRYTFEAIQLVRWEP